MELSPFRILKEAIKAVPAVKYALGVAGVASVIAIVAGFKVDYRIAVFGTIIMIALMLLLLIFSNAASPKNKRSLRLPSLALTWSFLLLIIFSTTLNRYIWRAGSFIDMSPMEKYWGGVCWTMTRMMIWW